MDLNPSMQPSNFQESITEEYRTNTAPDEDMVLSNCDSFNVDSTSLRPNDGGDTSLSVVIQDMEDVLTITDNKQMVQHSNFNELKFKKSLVKTNRLTCNTSPRVTRSNSKPKSDEIPPIHSEKRRCVQKPCKYIHLGTEEAIKQIYLNKNTRFAHKNLETIYEQPKLEKGNLKVIGTSKTKRSLLLNREFRIANKNKVKDRRAKIKRLLNSKQLKVKKTKLSNEEFALKMLALDQFLSSSQD